MGIDDFAAETERDALQDRITQLEAQRDKHLSEVKRLKAVVRSRDAEITDLEQVADFAEELRRTRSTEPAPGWLTPRKTTTKDSRGIPTLLLSDMHFDETVDLEEVMYVNRYDREIAEQRLQATFEKTVMVLRQYTAGLRFEGVNLILAGDGLSGQIHEELRRTNAALLLPSLLHWQTKLEEFVGGLADEFGKVHVTTVPGNHPRLSFKPIAKGRAEDNLDWLMSMEMALSFRGDDRVSFQTPRSADTMLQVYDTRYLVTHGDQFRGGSGISGIMAPLSLGHHRKTRAQMGFEAILQGIGAPPEITAKVGHFDWLVMGHWHQYMIGRGLIVNGSLKGYDEYAMVSNFPPEVPTQALWITTPEHGMTSTMPIYPMDAAREGWAR